MRMPGTTVDIVSEAMIELFGNSETQKTVIGARNGEKKHEVLVSKNEMPFARILNDKYFVILPQFASEEMKNKYSDFHKADIDEFNSNNADYLTKDKLIEILKNESWLWN